MRSEIKYLVPEALLPELRARIRPFVYGDPHAATPDVPEYVVRSVYFDTRSFRYYREKKAGLKNRKKLRIRGYDAPQEDALVFLEIKRRFENRLAKDRAPVRFEQLAALLASGNLDQWIEPGQAQADASKFFYHLRRYHLQPTLLVTYNREPYAGRFDRSLRITLDKRLRSHLHPAPQELFRDRDLVPALPGSFILEVKFDTRFPVWLTPILAAHGLRQRSLSKYVICLDTHPDWRRHRPPQAASHDPTPEAAATSLSFPV